MQYLYFNNNSTLTELSNQVGRRNVDTILAANGLKHAKNVGQQFVDRCKNAIATTKPVSSANKINILNTLTSDADVFETAALLGPDSWKVLYSLSTIPGTLRIPDRIKIPDSTSVLGGKSGPVGKQTYNSVIDTLQRGLEIDPSLFNDYNAGGPARAARPSRNQGASGDMFTPFNFPWGKIQLYSSLSDELIDFPCYPEEYETSRVANYTQMPDLLYQYEPWQLYVSSGPRTQEYTFHFHRDMWSGNHLDGKAIQLVRFCEANCYPDYKGSAVYTSTVKLLIDGKIHISGVMNSVSTKYSGPIGKDGERLEVTLTFTITEVSEQPLNYYSMKTMPVLGR